MQLADDAPSGSAFGAAEMATSDVLLCKSQRVKALLTGGRSGMPVATAVPDDLANVVVGVQVSPDVADMQCHTAIGQQFSSLRPRNVFTHDRGTLPVVPACQPAPEK